MQPVNPVPDAATMGDGDVQPGYVLGRYELLIPIAAGGMAQVWAARLRGARQFQKIVAVKTMLPRLSEDEQFEQMFLDEASLASRVRHPNVVEILDLGEHSGVLYLVMEWIEGVPLNQLMKAAKAVGGVPPHIAARIAMQACAGLHAAHELTDEKGTLVGLVHRDVSPQNVLVTYGGVTKVVDFGVAKATAVGGGATVAGQIKGKVGYMAPEQVRGEPLDRRVDVFAMGIVLYALTTGKHPFRRESEGATMYNICSPQPVMAPGKIIADYPPELEAIVLRALAKDRDERYASCDEMLRALDALPSHLRASSDADVAGFVRSLFDERRASRRKQLDEAIERADRVQPIAPGSGLFREPISGVTSTGGRPSFVTLQTGELSGIPTLPPNRSKWIGIAGLVALAISGGVLYKTLADRPTQDPASTAEGDVRVIEAPSVPKPTRPAPPATTAEAPPSPPSSAAEEEPEERKGTAEDTTEKPSGASEHEPPAKPTPRVSPAQPPAGPSKAADPPPKRQDSWKFDAGF